MKILSYRLARYLSRRLGVWFFRSFSWCIATGYFFLFPARVAGSVKFYRALFPGRSFPYHLYCAWKQFHGFTDVYMHRFIPWVAEQSQFHRDGWEHLHRAVADKTGAIVVMSHVGNWEIAAQRLGRKGMPVMLYMGAKHKEQVERIHKDNLARQGVRIVATDEKEKSPFALLEGIGFLREGGIVSMTGDRIWGEQTSVTVNFLGHETRLPDTPHLFALMSGAPLMTFFVHQDGAGVHQIKISPGRKVQAATRAERRKAVLDSAQAYADDLARFVAEHPFEWHHFEPFLGKKIDQTGARQTK